MHGVKRARVNAPVDSAEVERSKHEKEAKRIAEYKALVEEVYSKRDAHDYSATALELTTRLLSINQEFQTGWSIRRRILTNGILADADAPAKQRILENDLVLTNQALKQNPKNYSVWEHRKWVLETMPDADWDMEMKIVGAYLEKDGRNFHSWDYRRYVVSSILALDSATLASRTKPVRIPTTASELAYSSKKIAENFSNFSAWHYRTKLLPKLWEENGWGEGSSERAERNEEELELVKQAYWSDPNDQSAWLYHRWLVGKGTSELVRKEITGIEELLEEEPESRWCLESLVYYKRLLITLLTEQESQRSEREKLTLDCLGMIEKLEEVDSMRKMRYQDLKHEFLPYRR